MSSRNTTAKRKRTRTLESNNNQNSRFKTQYMDDNSGDRAQFMHNPFAEDMLGNEPMTADSLRDTLLLDRGEIAEDQLSSSGRNGNGNTYVSGNEVDGSALEFVNSVNYTSSKKVKKQRTVSLPQLPHARLLYESLVDDRRTQNDDELLHISGSTTQTVDGNRIIKLPLIRSVSATPVGSEFQTSSMSGDMQHMNINGSSGEILLSQQLLMQKSPSRLAKILKKSPILHTHHSLGFPNALSSAPERASNTHIFQTDKEGHYIYQENDIFANNRFQALELLGQGTFGKVVKCKDFKNDVTVAVKIIRAVDRYRQAAKTELRVLKTIKENDTFGQYQCLLLREYFDYKNHICLITDLYGRSVYDFMTNNGYARFPGSHVQAIGKQLIRSVCFLHDLGIIHTDLKPENILICDETCFEQPLPKELLGMITERRRRASGGKRKILINPEVKLIDFGSAVFFNEYHPPVVSTRHYRAPEIVLGLGWSFPCDIWSIACVLVELVTGESLYPIHENLEHMAMMQRINNEKFPKKMIDKMFYKVENKYGSVPSDLQATVIRHFDKATGELQWPLKDSKGGLITKDKSWKRVMTNCDRLDNFISKKLQMDYGSWLEICWDVSLEENWNLIASKNVDGDIDKNVFTFWYLFVDLCRKMFEFDPTKRITAKEAIKHEWFNIGILDEGITHYGRL